MCSGTGVENIFDEETGEQIGTVMCKRCKGEKQISRAALHEDLIDLLLDMNDKINDIFEKVNE